ncbi:MAG: hypothetical protein ACYSUD_17770 [Planctomycetota bacterium]
MAEHEAKVNLSQLECCPELRRKPVCDTLYLRYRLPFRPRVGDDNRHIVPVEVVLNFKFERCSGPLVIGDPVYSTTLLPGEKVRLFTSNRHNRWSYDSESSLSYRHETTSEESFFTAGMAQAMSDLTINESGASISTYEESWAEGGGGASFSFLGFSIGGGGGGGSYDAESLHAFSRSLSRHAESASAYAAASVRKKSTTSVGEVERRTHAEGESEAHYEASSRMFSNPNRCRAVTYLFYRIDKVQRMRFRLVAVERRIEDPAAPTGAYQRIPADTTGKITVLQQSIPATSKKRLEIEQMARTSQAEHLKVAASATGFGQRSVYSGGAFSENVAVMAREPINIRLRRAALAAVDKDLDTAGILDAKSGKPTERIIAELSWEREEILPTPGILVKGCLDKCETCEPALQEEIKLGIERKRLENELLKRQIELLDKSQEYRCCPAGSAEEEEEPPDE